MAESVPQEKLQTGASSVESILPQEKTQTKDVSVPEDATLESELSANSLTDQEIFDKTMNFEKSTEKPLSKSVSRYGKYESEFSKKSS